MGHIISVRFGYSLGIDLIPFKTCVYDVYIANWAKTTNKTIKRKSYIDIDFNEFEAELILKLDI